MKAAWQHNSSKSRRNSAVLTSIFTLVILSSAAAQASTQNVLERGSQRVHNGLYSGVVELAIHPGFADARVTVLVDGQKVAEGLKSPYHLVVDFGPAPLQHKITVIAKAAQVKRTQ